METPVIDYLKIKNDLIHLAEDDLRIISSGAMHLYAVNVAEYIKKYVAGYSEKTYSAVMDSLSPEKLDEFLNLESGYLVKMTNWISNTAIKFPEFVTIDEEVGGEAKSYNENIDSGKREKHICEYEDMTVIELLIDGFTSLFVRIPRRILSKFAQHYSQGTKTNYNSKENLRESSEKIKEKASVYISDVINEGIRWTKTAEQYSLEVLAQYQ